MKQTKIMYWLATSPLLLGFTASSAMYLTANDSIRIPMQQAGYPGFMLYLLGVAKLLAVVGLINPWFPKLKEWAYAGTVFVLSGAVWTHVATSTSFVPPLLFLLFTGASYYYNNKLVQAKS